jgi:glycosyltransferase involved in cell wall biosynthesis
MVFPKASVVVAPNGVDLERYANVPDAAEARARLHLAEAFTAGFTGHFYPGRGTDLLFELARRMPDVKFLWVGGTPQTVAEWRSRLSAAGQSNVTLTGFVDNSLLPLYQAAADVLLMPYGRAVAASSGQDIAEVINPMKMFEYMAAGRAIITADLPVIREVLDETRAVFCAPGNVEDWMSAILGLKAAADRRLRLAQNGRREVETCTWRAREERILQALELG